MLRRTKIVATLGPASSDPAILGQLIDAGVDVVRLNFSHGKAQDHMELAALVRKLAGARGRTVGIMVDLQGPKIRVGKFENDRVTLKSGAQFILDADCLLGNEERVGIDYKELPRDVTPGSVLLLNDGIIQMIVKEVSGNQIICTVTVGGVLSNNKGINRQGGGLTAPVLTDKDKEDIKTAAQLDADYLAVSFPKSGEDMNIARHLLNEAGGHAWLCAKIERTEAIDALEDILSASDSIMVARGDLGVEMGDAAIPALQKQMIQMARKMNKTIITATHMMESMINNPIPTRAEVSDVANAVLDGTDAVMLSAESAAGAYPVEAVKALDRVCQQAERMIEIYVNSEKVAPHKSGVHRNEAIAQATMYTANHLDVKAIGSMTQTGLTPLWMSRFNSDVPIYALSDDLRTCRKVTLFRGVQPIHFVYETSNREDILLEAERLIRQCDAVQDGDLVIMTIGEPIGKPGGTNTMKIIQVGEHR
ncbi:MAG: pyruvate kinase [Proteobacteria bacterium]|nr:pyruvate kinase [Pseudomonadota bacterium]